MTKNIGIGSSEPDDEGFTPSTNSSGPLPTRKPPHAASFEDEAMNLASADQSSHLKSSDLNHPYGDKGHGMGGGELLRRLGADGRKYGGQ